jgi:hypothetical protein
MSKLAEGKLARLLHGFSNKCPFSIVGLWGQIDVENEVPGSRSAGEGHVRYGGFAQAATGSVTPEQTPKPPKPEMSEALRN